MPKTSKKQPSLTQVKKILRDQAFDPRSPGPLSLISEVNDTNYYLQRTIEFLREEQEIRKMMPAHRSDVEHIRFKSAIRLLALIIANETVEAKT